MDMIIFFLKISTIFLIVNIIVAFITNIKENPKSNIVKLPKVYFVIGLIAYIVFHLPIIAYIGTNDYSKPEMITLFSIFIFMCMVIIVSCINWKIEFNEELFQYRTIFRHTLVIKYSDITKIKRLKSGSILIKAKHRWLIIDQYAVGRDEFLQMTNRITSSNRL